MRRVVPSLALLIALLPARAAAGDWRWLSTFTDFSSPALAEQHRLLQQPRLDGAGGYPVEDVHWRAEGFDLHLISGRVFLESPVEGSAMGAWFEGQATVTASLDDRNAEKSLQRWLSTPRLEAVPIEFAYILTYRPESVATELALGSEAGGAPALEQEYLSVKSSLEQMGMDLLYEYLNRDGRTQGTARVVFAPPMIRATGSQHAYVQYSFEPTWRNEIRLSVFGNKDFEQQLPHRFFYATLATADSATPRDFEEADVSLYSTRLALGAGKFSAEQEATIHFEPTKGLHAMSLSLDPQMAVTSVTDASGASLPFLQWKYLSTDPNFDQRVLVAFPETLPEGARTSITVSSAGALFERLGNIHWLMEEDEWFPHVNDPGASLYELFISVPRKYLAVASGELLSDEVAEGRRQYHFKTPRPVYGTTMYFGDFKMKSLKADDTRIEMYVDADDLNEIKLQDFTLNEVANAVKFYNRRLAPLSSPVLRVISTPTSHGRGFDGIILLSEGGFRNLSSDSDTFRAHEVAHQWWGNMIEPERWPEDRWLSESFADFMALEYYKTRYDKPEKLKDLIYSQWTEQYLDPVKWTSKNATGDRVGVTANDVAVCEGGGNVYSKGPEILHMLRYTFLVQKGNDDAFWAMMSSFLQENAYQQVTTEDFTAHAEKHLGMDLDWFWNQWLYGTVIPEVDWDHNLERADGGWLLTVNARQSTDFTLLIPVYIDFGGGRQIIRPVLLEGATGSRRLMLPEEPARVSLNRFHEALVRMRP